MDRNMLVTRARSEVAEVGGAPPVGTISLFEYVAVVARHRAFVALVAMTITITGTFYALSKPVMYDGNILIAVSDNRSAAQRGLLGEPVSSPSVKTAMSESEILKSRLIIGAVVDNLSLDRIVQRRKLPIIEEAVLRLERIVGEAENYDAGALGAKIGRFSVDASLLSDRFTVVPLGKNIYRLRHAESGLSIRGKVGDTLHASFAGAQVFLLITQMSLANSGGFELIQMPRSVVVEAIRKALVVSELGKASGMISVSYSDTDSERVLLILNELSRAYMEFVRSESRQESLQSLAVLQSKLPGLRDRVSKAEARYQSFREANGTADLEEETRLRVGRYSEARAELAGLRQKRADLGVRLGDNHPILAGLDRQIAAVSAEAGSVQAEVRQVPATSTQLSELLRVVRTESQLYETVLRRIEELNVLASNTSSNVRVVDEAVEPHAPKASRGLIIIFSIVLGLSLGIFGAFVREFLALRKNVPREHTVTSGKNARSNVALKS